MYELFVDRDNQIREWTFHRGGSQKPTLAASWENYRKAGPLLISLDHRGTKDGRPIHIFFTDVAVKPRELRCMAERSVIPKLEIES